MFLYWGIVFLLLKDFYLPDGFPACLFSFAFFYKDQKSKILVGAKLKKLFFRLLEDFFWRSPGTLKRLFVDVGLLYLLIYSASQDHAWLLRFWLSPLLSLGHIKWKMVLSLVCHCEVCRLSVGDYRAKKALQTGISWICLD